MIINSHAENEQLGTSSLKMSLKARFCGNMPTYLLCEAVELRQITFFFPLLDGVKNKDSFFFFFVCPVGGNSI